MKNVMDTSSNSGAPSKKVNSAHKFKLPQIEFKKFGGDIKEWLPFWSQFKKIHEDSAIPPEDKFQYLLLAITPNTRARELVESYPPTAANYEEVIKGLKSRFGREEMLIEVYVRVLLKLVINNALPNSNRCNLLNLYDKIETQLRALETLGITVDTYASMLYPLVESCLPEDLLRVWQRSTEFSKNEDNSLKSRLNRLITFMKTEVESEERIALAVEGFGLGSSDKQKKTKTKSSEFSLPTAAGLLNCETSKCLFCEGAHSTDNCFKAQKMTLEQKRKIVADKRACFRCAKMGHAAKRCRYRMKCVLCGAQHIVLLCPNLENKNCTGKVNNGDTKSETVQKEYILANYTKTPVFLQTLRVKMRNENKERVVRAIFDGGSQSSYILETTAREMKYPVKSNENIVHELFGGTKTPEQKHKCYDVRLSSLDGSYLCKFEVLDHPRICSNIASVYPGSWTQELQKQNIHLTDSYGNDPIELLIGADVLGKLYTGKRHILSCGLVAMQTLLGWVLTGRVPNSKSSSNTNMIVTSLLNQNMAISNLWQLDVLGITDPGEKQSKIELEEATKAMFNETICRNSEDRYEVCLPWREGHPPLPSYEELAKKRLDSTVRKLQNTGYYERYEEVFTEWLTEGIIEEVPQQELSYAAHYLPHRPVIKESSATTKIRPVFDASAKEKGKPALNDCLEKGPNLLELIPSLLLRFRQDKMGVTADIKKAFLQISLNKNNRDFLRFLWKTRDGVEKVYRHRRVVFGVNASPFLLNATIQFHLHHSLKECEDNVMPYSKKTIEKLLNTFYVDNCVTSLPDVEALSKFIKEATEVMAQAKFELRGWEHNGNPNDTSPIPLLGLIWDKGKDVLAINHQSTEIEKSITKRIILSTTQKIFDPIGFTCAATIFPKLLLQKMWEQKINWDKEVDEDTKRIFLRWVSELSYLTSIEIPRWIEADPVAHLSIHTFCDASGVAYAAAIFLRVEKQDTVKIHLLLAKSRVAPIKKITIPRLELLAACIGARLYTIIQEVFGKDIESYFWSDSTTALSWIRREEEWGTFVWNRVREIRKFTSTDSWRHVPGVANPADLLSRGCSPKQLAQSKWWEGPSWLYCSPDKWPQEENYPDETEIYLERKKKVLTTMLNKETTNFYNYFSKYQQTVRMIGWMYRFTYNCRNKNNKRREELSAEEYESAEKTLIRIIQKETFLNEDDKQFLSLNVFRDKEDLLRVRTPISRREDCETFKYPYLLPQKHEVVKKLIYDVHVRSCHVGISGLMNILRERYWILGGRRIIRSVIHSCKLCKRHQAKCMKTMTTELPLDRVRDANTFEIVGIDLAGPVYTKEGKVWICIFTCAVYRAIHLDITMSASTSDFLKTLRRFIARRGRPRVIYTDNGTNFCGAENIFAQLNWDEISQFSSARRIVWRFNPPSAPWWGGWWERMVGMLKILLKKTLGRAKLNNEELYTVICDCESVINSRPLTHMSNDPLDLIPLTPEMFLRESTETGVPDCDSADASMLNRRLKYLQTLRADLRKRFRIEYLGQLHHHNKCKTADSVSIGDIVLIGNDNEKRIHWPIARVTELFPGKDGKIRLVKLRTANGSLLRPIQRLYQLEGANTSSTMEPRSNASNEMTSPISGVIQDASADEC